MIGDLDGNRHKPVGPLVISLVAALTIAGACGTRVDLTRSVADGPAVGAPTNGGTVTPGSATSGNREGSAAGAGTGASAGAPGGTAPPDTQPALGGTSTGGAARAPESAATGTPLILGSVGTQSGILGEALQPSWQALEAWMKWVNAHGGVAGHPVQLITADDAGDPGKNAVLTTRMIEENHVVAFVGDFAPTSFSGAVPVLERTGVPAIGGETADPHWYSSAMAFPLNAGVASISTALGAWGIANLTETNAALFYPTEAPVGKQGADTFAQRWRAGGGQVVAETGISIVQPDFTAEVLQAKSAGAGVVFLFDAGTGCQNFWDAARRQHYSPKYLTEGCGANALTTGGDQTVGRSWFGTQFSPALGQKPADEELIEAIRRYSPDTMKYVEGGEVLFGWLSGKLFEAAARNAGGDLSTAGIVKGLHALRGETLGGFQPALSYGPGPHTGGHCGNVVAWEAARTFKQVTPTFVC